MKLKWCIAGLSKSTPAALGHIYGKSKVKKLLDHVL